LIGFIRGKTIDWTEETVTIDCGGVGYELFCSSRCLDQILSLDDEVKLWVHTHVKEDAITLFGFFNKNSRELFLSLLKVNGVGPKLAQKILSGIDEMALSAAIESGNIAALTSIPKVGRKTAEQIVIALRGKVKFSEASTRSQAAPVSSLAKNHGHIYSALSNLGFSNIQINEAIGQLEDGVEVEAGIRQCLLSLNSLT